MTLKVEKLKIEIHTGAGIWRNILGRLYHTNKNPRMTNLTSINRGLKSEAQKLNFRKMLQWYEGLPESKFTYLIVNIMFPTEKTASDFRKNYWGCCEMQVEWWLGKK